MDITKNYLEYLRNLRSLRPCTVDGRCALFHMWFTHSQVIPPSLLIGGHSGGVITQQYALVEYEDGTMSYVNPFNIKFLDTISQMNEFETCYLSTKMEMEVKPNEQG